MCLCLCLSVNSLHCPLKSFRIVFQLSFSFTYFTFTFYFSAVAESTNLIPPLCSKPFQSIYFAFLIIRSYLNHLIAIISLLIMRHRTKRWLQFPKAVY